MSELPLALAIYADLDLGKLVTADGNSLILPDGKLGDTWLCSLRFLSHTLDAVRERDLNVRAVRASIGNVMTPPTSGTFTLRGPTTWVEIGTVSSEDGGNMGIELTAPPTHAVVPGDIVRITGG